MFGIQISKFCVSWRGKGFWCSHRRGAMQANGWSVMTTATLSSTPSSLTASSCPTTCTVTFRERSRSGSASSKRGCSCTPLLITSEFCVPDTQDPYQLVTWINQWVMVFAFHPMQVYAPRWSPRSTWTNPGELPAEGSKDSEKTAVSLWWESFFKTCSAIRGHSTANMDPKYTVRVKKRDLDGFSPHRFQNPVLRRRH